MKRISARAIIFEGDYFYALFRRKKNAGRVHEYYSIPGGGVEENETLEDTVKRELKEELQVDINLLGYLGSLETDTCIFNYYHAEIINGTPTLGGEEGLRNSNENYYEISKINIKDLENVDILGKEYILNAFYKNYK